MRRERGSRQTDGVAAAARALAIVGGGENIGALTYDADRLIVEVKDRSLVADPAGGEAGGIRSAVWRSGRLYLLLDSDARDAFTAIRDGSAERKLRCERERPPGHGPRARHGKPSRKGMSMSDTSKLAKHGGSAFKTMQKVGKAFMLPIAILPAAGLLLGIGGAFSSEATIAAYPFLNIGWLQVVFKVMNAAGNVVFSNLPLLLCIGLCVGLAHRDKGVAALAGVVGYLVMTGTTTTLLSIFNPKGSAIDTGVVGALALGAIAVNLHNRYRNIQLPQVLGFFGGSRFVPIITTLAAIVLGCLFYVVWPPLQGLLTQAGQAISAAGVIGTFFYGFLMRLCGAVGLHHMIYPMFWYTELGGVAEVAGKTVVGAQPIFFAELADPNYTGLFSDGTRFFAGRFSTMMFGLPGAALAMYHCVDKDRRSKYAGLFLGVAATSFITGITEPLEYMFLFVSPLLYVFHSFLDGVSFLVADLLQIRIGNTFSGGFIDFFLFGILQGNAKTNWLREIPFGAVWFFLYYFSFRFAIRKWDIKTPGRDDDEPELAMSGAGAAVADLKGIGGSDSQDEGMAAEADQIIAALGGAENIQDVDACITRLRVSVKDPSLVDDAAFKRLGSAGVLRVEGGVQAIFGAKAVLYKSAICDKLGLDY